MDDGILVIRTSGNVVQSIDLINFSSLELAGLYNSLVLLCVQVMPYEVVSPSLSALPICTNAEPARLIYMTKRRLVSRGLVSRRGK